MLTQLFGSSARVEMLSLLLSEPDREFYVREIERLACVQVHAVHVELRRLESLGLVTSRRDGNRRYVQAVATHPMYAPLLSLILAGRTGAFNATDIVPMATADGESVEGFVDVPAPLDPQNLSWLLKDLCAVAHYLLGDHFEAAYLCGPYGDDTATGASPVEVVAIVDELEAVPDLAPEIETLVSELRAAYGVDVSVSIQDGGSVAPDRSGPHATAIGGRRIG
ncbi:MAG: winged helix-turn-helix domain-containing protein [Thermoleophilia bacterium]